MSFISHSWRWFDRVTTEKQAPIQAVMLLAAIATALGLGLSNSCDMITLQQHVGHVVEVLVDIEDPKLSAGDLTSVGPRRVGEGDRVYLVSEANSTDVTIRWITTWDVLDRSGCEGRLIRLLTNREVNQLKITEGDEITSPVAGCFASLVGDR